jgi:osomolarity two-component system sensor histidine kinase CHK1
VPVNGSAVIRLGEPIIRNGDTPARNFRFDAMYGQDPYFKEKMPASILCMPISKLGGFHFIIELTTVLYLENAHMTQAFPPKRVLVLKLLCAQAAVTIDRAQMFRGMEEAKQSAEAATHMKSTCISLYLISNI